MNIKTFLGFLMERVKILNLITLALTFLALVPKMESQMRSPIFPLPALPSPPQSPPLRPLCASQFALANYACGQLRTQPTLPSLPNPLLPDRDEDDDGSHQRHGHRHGHSHRHRHELTASERNCCRWAREMDSQCVCEVLLRLPLSLSRPRHRFTVSIGESCDVTYTCGGTR